MFGGTGYMEMIIIAGIALLLFGKRLPEVARSVGKGIVEFKKGVSGIEDEVHKSTTYSQPSSSPRPMASEEQEEVTAPKFEPPELEPAETVDAESEAK